MMAVNVAVTFLLSVVYLIHPWVQRNTIAEPDPGGFVLQSGGVRRFPLLLDPSADSYVITVEGEADRTFAVYLVDTSTGIHGSAQDPPDHIREGMVGERKVRWEVDREEFTGPDLELVLWNLDRSGDQSRDLTVHDFFADVEARPDLLRTIVVAGLSVSVVLLAYVSFVHVRPPREPRRQSLEGDDGRPLPYGNSSDHEANPHRDR